MQGARSRIRAVATAAVAAFVLVGTLGVTAAAGRTLASWPLDEGAGATTADASGQGHTGTLGSPTGASAPAWVPGRAGAALRFDGTSDERVAIADPSTLTPEHLTVVAWVRRLDDPGAYRYVFSYGARECARGSYGLYTGASGGISFYVSDAGGYVTSPSADAATVWDGGWHQVAGTFDGSVLRLYVDGREVGTGRPAALSIDYSLGAVAYLGTFRGSCQLPFTGDVDELSIHDVALDRAAIVALGAGLGPQPAQLPPVAGAPPGGSAAGAGSGASPGAGPARPSPATTGSCARVTVSRRSVRVGRRTPVVVTVRRGRQVAGGRTVTVSGGGVQASARTARRTGRATLSLRPRRKGTLRVALKGQAHGCAAPTIAAR